MWFWVNINKSKVSKTQLTNESITPDIDYSVEL